MEDFLTNDAFAVSICRSVDYFHQLEHLMKQVKVSQFFCVEVGLILVRVQHH